MIRRRYARALGQPRRRQSMRSVPLLAGPLKALRTLKSMEQRPFGAIIAPTSNGAAGYVSRNYACLRGIPSAPRWVSFHDYNLQLLRYVKLAEIQTHARENERKNAEKYRHLLFIRHR